MHIAFLHQPNDPYPEIRIKYFLKKGYKVSSIVFPKKDQQKPINGLNIITLPKKFLNKVPFAKRFIYAKYIKQITQNHKLDILYIVNALNCYYLKKSAATKNILELEGSDVILAPKSFPFLKHFYKKYWKYADAITQDSKVVYNHSLHYKPQNVPSKIIEIGVDFKIFNKDVEKGFVRKKYNLNQKPIIFNSRSISKLYNYDIFFKSLKLVKKRYNDICYMITGSESSLDNETKKFISENNLQDNIIFTGWLDHESEMKYYYADADVVISIPSSDSSPFSVYEAMALKTPVIVTDLPWLKDNFSPNEQLLTVPLQDVAKLAENILMLLDKKIKIDTESAYQKVLSDINMVTENEKLEKLFISL